MLEHAYRKGRLAHAYLVTGSPRGAAGELALHVLRLLACRAPEPPCGECDICRQVTARTWCDNFWLAPQKKSRVISIDQLRHSARSSSGDGPLLLPWLNNTAFAGGWKAAVIEWADRFNEAAGNAFLKMLEEPPHDTVMLLLTEAPQALLPTIRSRCQRVDLEEPPSELPPNWRGQLLEVLDGPPIKGPAAAMAAAARLSALLNEMKATAEAAIREETQEVEDSGLEESNATVSALVSSRYRESRGLLLMGLLRWYRDLLALRSGADESVVFYRDRLESLQRRAQGLTLAQALDNIESVEELGRQLERSLNETNLLSYWLDRLQGGT